MGTKNPLLFGFRGHIGKTFVVKQFSYGAVVSRFPRMGLLKPSIDQKAQRRSFKEARRIAGEFPAFVGLVTNKG